MAQGVGPLLGVVVVSLGLAGGFVALKGPEDVSPVAVFNHALHIERDLECADCHTGVEVHARAGIPSITICADCHEGDSVEDLGGTENAKLIHSHLESGEELWWRKRYVLPDYILFSHRRHVGLGEIACAECHGQLTDAQVAELEARFVKDPDRVARMKTWGAMSMAVTVPEKPVESTLTMDGCMDCHARHGADLDCWACHR